MSARSSGPAERPTGSDQLRPKHIRLERVLQPKLHLPLRAEASQDALRAEASSKRRRGRELRRRIRELRRVKEVEHFVAKFQSLAFPHRETLEQRKVPVVSRGPNQRIPANIPGSDRTRTDRRRDGVGRNVDLLGSRVAG